MFSSTHHSAWPPCLLSSKIQGCGMVNFKRILVLLFGRNCQLGSKNYKMHICLTLKCFMMQKSLGKVLMCLIYIEDVDQLIILLFCKLLLCVYFYHTHISMLKLSNEYLKKYSTFPKLKSYRLILTQFTISPFTTHCEYRRKYLINAPAE